MNLRHLCGGELPAVLLFDLDGTLLDSLPDLTTAIDRMLLELGLAPAGVERVHGWIGDGARQLVREALVFAQGDTGDAGIDTALTVYTKHYADCCTDRSRLFSGVAPALLHWFEHGVAMACVTNKGARFTERLIDHFQLRQLLPVLVCGDTLPQRKPDPAPLLLACKHLGVAPARALMVGDSRNDVRAARAAGMSVACVDYGYNHGRAIADESPDLIVSSLQELIG